MGWARRSSCLWAVPEASFVQGKVWPHYEAQEINQKTALQQGAAEVPGVGVGSLGEPGPKAGPQETRGHCSFQWGQQRSGRELH